MTIDSSIPLQVKTPTVADMLANAASFQGLKSTDQAQQLTQNKLNSMNAIGSINPDEYDTAEEAQKAQNSAMAKAGAANNIPQNKILNATATAEQAHALAEHYNTYNKGLKVNQQTAANLLNKEDLSPSDIGYELQEGVKAGRIPQQFADKTMEEVAQTDGSTPALKKIVHGIYGQTLSLEQTTPTYELKPVEGGYQHFQTNPNATDPATGKQGVNPISNVIPTTEVKNYTDSNNIQKTVPLSVYNKMVKESSENGGHGLQIGANPGTASDIAFGTKIREQNQNEAEKEKPEYDRLVQARNLIYQHKDDPALFGANTDFTQKVARLAVAAGILYKGVQDTATATDQLNAMGIDPHANTYESAMGNIDFQIGKRAAVIKKAEAQSNFEKNYGNSPEQQKEFNAAWNKVDPNTFVYKNKISKEDKLKFFNSLPESQQKSLIQSLKHLNVLGVQ